jgi:uncharacterized protein
MLSDRQSIFKTLRPKRCLIISLSRYFISQASRCVKGVLRNITTISFSHIAKASLAFIICAMTIKTRQIFAAFAPLLFTVFAFPAVAQQAATTTDTATVAEDAFTNGPAIFVIRDDDTTIYFLGTTHVLPPDINWQTTDMQTLFTKSEELVLEVSDADSDASSTEMEKLFLERKRGPDSKILAELIWPENRAEFRKWARELTVTARELDAIPLWQMSFIFEYGLAFEAGATSEDGVESVLTKIYTDAGKPIGSIETAMSGLTGLSELSDEDQIAPFNGILYERRYAFSGKAESEEDVFAREKAWAEGEVTEFDFGDESMLLKDGTYRALIYDRNVQWTDWITARMDRPGHLLLAVGSAHLSGPHSVLRLLEKKGYRVERLTKSMLYGPQ